MDLALTHMIETDASASLRLHAAELLELGERTRHPATARHLGDLAVKCLKLALEVEQTRDEQEPRIIDAALASRAMSAAGARGSEA
jgi:hypothetical protein